MRKAWAFLIVLMLLAGMFCVPALAAVPEGYSKDAADHFCTVWNEYYSRNNMNLYAGYILDDDNNAVRRLCIIYNGDNRQVRYESGLIPPASDLFFLYDFTSGEFGFRVFSDGMKSNLEAVRAFADSRAVFSSRVSSSHDSGDAWILSVPGAAIQSLLSCERFTLELTIDGEKHNLLISRENYRYLYDMVGWLAGAKQYGNPDDEMYLSTDLLPEDSRPTPTPAPSQASAYSFREDLDAIDSAAKSVFYIEILDKHKEAMGRASGFVAFDEHLLVTNQHVIENAYYLQVEGEDGSTYLLDKVIVSDKTHDIAILLFPEGKNYTALELDSDSVLKRGQPVVTIGNPIGYRGTVAYGNISAFPVLEDYGDLKCIQFTAPTSHGSSGGCLFDNYGKVIGVTSAIGVSYSGEVGNDVGLAVPVGVVQDLYARWDKFSYEPLGTQRSWDMVRVTATPSPQPQPETAFSLGSMHWEMSDGDKVILSFDVSGSSFADTVDAFELCLYTTDSAGVRVYGENLEFKWTTGKTIVPGGTVTSDKFVIPQWSKAARVYCRIRRVRPAGSSTFTLLDTEFNCYGIK